MWSLSIVGQDQLPQQYGAQRLVPQDAQGGQNLFAGHGVGHVRRTCLPCTEVVQAQAGSATVRGGAAASAKVARQAVGRGSGGCGGRGSTAAGAGSASPASSQIVCQVEELACLRMNLDHGLAQHNVSRRQRCVGHQHTLCNGAAVPYTHLRQEWSLPRHAIGIEWPAAGASRDAWPAPSGGGGGDEELEAEERTRSWRRRRTRSWRRRRTSELEAEEDCLLTSQPLGAAVPSQLELHVHLRHQLRIAYVSLKYRSSIS